MKKMTVKKAEEKKIMKKIFEEENIKSMAVSA